MSIQENIYIVGLCLLLLLIQAYLGFQGNYIKRESKHFLGQGAKDWANMGLMALSGSLKEKETITVENCEV